MIPKPSVLVLDRDPHFHKTVGALRIPGIQVDPALTIIQAIESLKLRRYEAALCRVDEVEEISSVVRLKHASPTTTLLALIPPSCPALEDLAFESGADDVQTRETREADVSRNVARALGIRTLDDRAQAAIARSEALSLQSRELIAQHRREITRSRLLSASLTDPIRAGLAQFFPLVVEDDPVQAELLELAFLECSFPLQPSHAHDGAEAIDILSRKIKSSQGPLQAPTLVILDINMPRKSGLEVLAWIRDREVFARLPVFMLSSAVEYLDQAMALGANYFYPKRHGSEALRQLANAITVRWWFTQEAWRSKSG